MSRPLPAHLTTADLRQTILDAADRLLAAKGFRDFTMEELATEIGIAKGTTYLYFDGKEAVALAVIDRSVDRVMAKLSAIAGNGEGAAIRLKDMLEARVILRHRNIAHYDRARLADLFRILRNGLHERRERFSSNEIGLFSRVIREGVESGEFLRCDPQEVATSMFWSTEGLLPSHLSLSDLGERAIGRRVVDLAKLLVAAVAVSEKRRVTSGKRRARRSAAGLSMLSLPLFWMLGVSAGAGAQSTLAPTVAPGLTVSRVDSLFATYSSPSSPGCAVGVDSSSRDMLRRAYGMASLELGVPNAPQTIYYGASLAKQFTAAAILMLVEERKVGLSDKVRRILPELPPSDSAITVLQLLEHTSGIRDYRDLLLMSGGHDVDPTDVPRVLDLLTRQQALNFEPGSQFSYSNSGYVLLAEIVRRLSGRSLRDFANQRIFQPLKMGHTQFVEDHAQLIVDRATGHRNSGKEWGVAPYLDDVYGDGGLFTTVDDLLIWDRNLITGQVGGRDLVARLATETHLTTGKQTGFGLGLETGKYRGRNFVGHGGRSFGAQNYTMTFPAEQISIAVLCNARDIDAEMYARRIASFILAAPQGSGLPATQETVAANVDSKAMLAVEGIYFNPRTLAIRRVDARDGKLVWRGTAILQPVSSSKFRFPGQPAAVVFSDFRASKAGKMTIVSDAGDSTEYVRAEPFDMPKNGLPVYEGVYSSAEVLGTYQVAVSDSALSFRAVGSSFSFVAFPAMKDGFKGGEDVLITFDRNVQGTIKAFRFSTGRARNVLFVLRPDGRLNQSGP